MGKKRIAQLLDQLETNHQEELQNAAAIFAVAQVAVNQLEQQATSPEVPRAALAPAPAISKEALKQQLKQQYGSFNACRNAAKKKGIRFHKKSELGSINSRIFTTLKLCNS